MNNLKPFLPAIIFFLILCAATCASGQNCPNNLTVVIAGDSNTQLCTDFEESSIVYLDTAGVITAVPFKREVKQGIGAYFVAHIPFKGAQPNTQVNLVHCKYEGDDTTCSDQLFSFTAMLTTTGEGFTEKDITGFNYSLCNTYHLATFERNSSNNNKPCKIQ